VKTLKLSCFGRLLIRVRTWAKLHRHCEQGQAQRRTANIWKKWDNKVSFELGRLSDINHDGASAIGKAQQEPS
jgi:hypothetical protein